MTCLGLACPAAFAQHFRVQLIATADSLPEAYFAKNGLKKVWRTTDGSGINHYYYGSYLTRLDAEAVCRQMIEKGFSQATVIDMEVQRLLTDQQRCAYYKGGPLPLAENDTVRFIYFDTGKATLSETSKKHLFHMLERLKADPTSVLYVLGYADAIGATAANLELATERARAARNFLLGQGIDPVRIRVYAYGEAEASAVEDIEEERSEYERAEMRKRFRCAILVWRKEP